MTIHDALIEPFIERDVLYLTEGHRLSILSPWQNKLELKFSEDGTVRPHYLYDYFGMSLSPAENTHPAVRQWMETIPKDVRAISQNFPEAPFYCAQILASFDQATEMAIRCQTLFYAFIYYCKDKHAPYPDLTEIFSQGPQSALRYMGFNDGDEIAMYFEKVTPRLMQQVLPGFVIACGRNDAHRRFLTTLNAPRQWHFQLLALFPWMANTKLSTMLTQEFKEDVSILGVFGFSQQSKERANAVFKSMKTLSPKQQESLCRITTLPELYRSINTFGRELAAATR